MFVGKTQVGGLGGVSIRVPESGLIIVANLSNDKGSSLTFSALCTRKRHHCIRDLSTCTHRFLKHVDGPRYSCVGNVPPTVTVRRGIGAHGPHSAIKASARVCRCLQLLCTHVKGAVSPISKGRIGGRRIDSVIGRILNCPTKAHFTMCTPIILPSKHDVGRRLRVLRGRNCAHLSVGRAICHVNRMLTSSTLLSCPIVRLLVSHLIMSSSGALGDHLTSSTRATFFRKRSAYVVHVCASRKAIMGRCSGGFRTSNVIFRRPASVVFDFGGPLNTYPAYRNFKGILNVSRGLIIPSGDLSIFRKTMIY